MGCELFAVVIIAFTIVMTWNGSSLDAAGKRAEARMETNPAAGLAQGMGEGCTITAVTLFLLVIIGIVALGAAAMGGA